MIKRRFISFSGENEKKLDEIIFNCNLVFKEHSTNVVQCELTTIEIDFLMANKSVKFNWKGSYVDHYKIYKKSLIIQIGVDEDYIAKFKSMKIAVLNLIFQSIELAKDFFYKNNIQFDELFYDTFIERLKKM